MLQTSATAKHSAAEAGDLSDPKAFLCFVKRVRNVFGGGDGGVYSKFLDFMELYQFGEITGVEVYMEVVKLFEKHKELVVEFKSLVPVRRKRKIDDRVEDGPTAVKKLNRCVQTKTEDVKNRALEPRRSSLMVSQKNSQTFAPIDCSVYDFEVFLDFLKRVRTRFGDGGVYGKFLGYMESYQFGEISGSDVYVEIVKLFRKHKDLVALFKSLVPGKTKRKINDRVEDRSCNPQTRNRERIMSKEEEIDFSMEDLLFEVDVKISNLESTYKNAMKFSTLDVVCFNEHFTPLNLAFIRKLSRKQLLDNADPAAAVSEVIRLLNKKREALHKSRDNIIKRWNKSRQSR